MKEACSVMFMRSTLNAESLTAIPERPPCRKTSRNADKSPGTLIDSSGAYPLLKTYPSWSVLEQYGLEFIKEYRVLKVEENDKIVTAVLEEGTDAEAAAGKLWRFHAPRSVDLRIAPAAEFRSALARYFSREETGGIKDPVPEFGGLPAPLETLTEDAPTVNLVNSIILDAVRIGASDIHIVKDDESMRVRYRLDGLLQTVAVRPPERFASVSSRIKLMANLNIMESRLPQDGRLTVTLGGRDVHIRLSTVPLIRGESLVLRIFQKAENLIRPDNLGFPQSTVKALRRILAAPHGLLLTTGPTGSGKTTTLGTFLTEIKEDYRQITTIEDPVEYIIPGIEQIQVNEAIGLTFESLLRRVLRQDPDVMMVGEIRDPETAMLAVRAALTGHLVLATLHTLDAPSAISRLTDMGVPPYLLSAVLKGVLAQRLVRRLCPVCGFLSAADTDERSLAAAYGISESGGRIFADEQIRPESVRNLRFGRAKGCSACGKTGYSGRIAVSEWFSPDEKTSATIASGHWRPDGEERENLFGYVPMLRDAFAKAAMGITTVEEIRRAVIS